MLFRLAGIALVLTFALPALAQEPTPIDIAILSCVGPGFIPDGDPFAVLDDLDPRYCKRACKAAEQGCKLVAKAIDKCGASFLKASAKVGVQVCRGWGFSARECRGIKDEAKGDINWWKAQGKIEQSACASETQIFCLSRCQ
jgi:hypothetical protein